MYGPLYHLLLALPIFAFVLLFLVVPALQWASERRDGRRFVLRFAADWRSGNKEHRRDVLFSILAVLLSVIIALIILELLIAKGILPPFS
jgi:hypothetical protein